MTNPTPHGQVPEALRLADEISKAGAFPAYPRAPYEAAAAELRRLHAENEAIRTPHVQTPAEIEHVAGDVSKTGPESNMAQQPSPTSPEAKFTEIIQSWCGARCLPMPSADDCQSLLLSLEAARTPEDSQPAQFVDQTSANLSDKAVCASTVIDKPARARAPADSQPADGAVAGPVDDLAELALLNRLIELGSKAACAHATSNSDDGHKGTAAYVEWQELRAEMGELIRTAYAAAPTPPAQAADSVSEAAYSMAVAMLNEMHQRMGADVVRKFNFDSLAFERIAQRHMEAALVGRKDLQMAGSHPAPCGKFCEAQAFRIENRNLKSQLAAARAPADSVLEDAARWHWIAEYLVGPRTDLDNEIVASETAHELRKLVDADRAARAPADSVLEDAALPMQPICIASDGVIRFKQNRMVYDLYAFGQPRGFGLNEMARRDYTQEERMQFAQLIGYSVSGYGGLSYASLESAEKADAIADSLIAARKQGGA